MTSTCDSQLSVQAEEPSAALAPGSQVGGRYVIEDVVGQGGCGTIYRAEHLGLARKVAIKVPHADLDEHAQLHARFLREVRISARVRHPHLMEVHDAGSLENGQPYLVMELLEGETLHDRMERGRLDDAHVVAIMDQLLAAVSALSAARIVHRDIKPANVMLCGTPGASDVHVKLIDFGIARSVDHDGKLTLVGSIVGTPDYMAPEQLMGSPVDERVDVYACGVILYELLTGANPHAGASYQERLRNALRAKPVQLRLPSASALSSVVLKALAPHAADRYPSAASMREALHESLRVRPGVELLVAAARRAPRLSLSVGLVLLAAALVPRSWLASDSEIAVAHAGAASLPVEMAKEILVSAVEPAHAAADARADSSALADTNLALQAEEALQPGSADSQTKLPGAPASRSHARALRALAAGDYARAEVELGAALKRDPTHVGALRARVVLAHAQGDNRGAQAALTRYAALHPTAPDLPELRNWLAER